MSLPLLQHHPTKDQWLSSWAAGSLCDLRSTKSASPYALSIQRIYIHKIIHHKHDWCPSNFYFYTNTGEVMAGFPHFFMSACSWCSTHKKASMARCWVNTPPRGFRRARGTWGPYRWAAEMVKLCVNTSHGTNWQMTAMMWRFIHQWEKNQFTT